MIRSLSPFPAALVLGCALGAAAAAPVRLAAGMEIPAGTTLKLAAAAKPQQVDSPTALAFDAADRLVITEGARPNRGVGVDRQRLEWYGDDLASNKTSDRLTLYEKWKGRIAPAYLPEKSGRVRRLADGDGDGVFEQSKVLAAGFNEALAGAANGVYVLEGAVYVACLPKLWLLPDGGAAGVAAGRKVLQDGFGVRISPRGHDLGGLTLGPDGRLYGVMGDRGLSLTTKEGRACQFPNEGCAFRIELDGSGFEVFHRGLRNPKDIAFDALGNAFTVDGNAGHGDASRLIYLVEGGDSGWQMEDQTMLDFHPQIGLAEAPPNRWMDEHRWELRHDLQPAYILPPVAHLSSAPAGLTVHPGTGFLEAEAGRFLICDPGRDAAHSGIRSLAMIPDGAGMKLADSRQLLQGMAANALQYSWDGKLFVSDAATNRIYSLSAGTHLWRAAEAAETAQLMREGFSQRDSAALAMLLKHPDARVRLRAQIALTRLPDAIARFASATTSADAMERVHGIWGLGILARRGSGVPLPVNDGFGTIPDRQVRLAAAQKLVALLQNPDAEVRAQAVRVIGDAQNQFVETPASPHPSPAPKVDTFMTAEGLPLAALLFDASPRVRYFAAMSIGKLKALGFYGALCDFLKDNNNRDPYLRHAGAFALQHISIDPRMLAGLDQHPSAAVRLGTTVALRYGHEPAAAAFINDTDPQVAQEAIRAVTDLSLEEVRVSLTYLLDKMAASAWQPFTMRRLIHNGFRMGSAQNAARLLKLVGDPAIPVEVQKETLRLLALWSEPPPVDQLTGHWRPLPKRDPAEIKPALTSALPRLLQQDGFIRAAALKLAKQYQVEVSAAATPPATPPAPKR